MQTPDTVIFQGPDVRDITTGPTEIKIEFTLANINQQITNHSIRQNGLVIINTHGRNNSALTHRIHQVQLRDSSWARTKNIFIALANSNCALTVQLFACFSSAACINDVVSQLPRGSLVAFYAPVDDISRMEVAEKLIDKSLELKRNGKSSQEILWCTTPFCQSFISYHHPSGGVKRIELPDAGFHYTKVKNQSELFTARCNSVKNYNSFLTDNALPPISEQIFGHLNWFKDMWFMQLVIELVSSDQRRQAAVTYLKSVDNNLKFHKMSLAGMPSMNLLEYFQAWSAKNSTNQTAQARDNVIVQDLIPIYPPITPAATAAAMPPGP